jgi:hypothetical protein
MGLAITQADVVELVDTLDLGSSAERRGGSSPLIRTSGSFETQHAL